MSFPSLDAQMVASVLSPPSAGDLRELPGVPLRGEGSCGGGGAPRDSAGSGATEEGLTSRGGRHLRLPLRFGLRPQGKEEKALFLRVSGKWFYKVPI